MYKIQNLLLGNIIGMEEGRELFYRGPSDVYQTEEGYSLIRDKSFFDLFTYFNSVSVEKWRRYTFANRFYLVLDIEGDFTIKLFGHYYEREDVIKKELLGSFAYNNMGRSEVIIPFPEDFKSTLVGFYFEAFSDVKLYDGYYAVDLEQERHNNPHISLVTTTFKKEKYINKNIEALKSELFDDEEYKECFSWYIIDNGRTLEEYDDGKIKILHNKNVGGAGGFARGMIEALRAEQVSSHILLMDDDVDVMTESFKRTYHLLDILRDEYKDWFISGAMLNMDAPNIQHENTGYFCDRGYGTPVNHNLDMSVWKNVLKNEIFCDGIKNRYAAWWYCCIPTSVARLDNLPMPVFVRGDDMEYSLRNNAQFITMNGICIWHEGFANRFSLSMEYYQGKRNDLIVSKTKESLDTIKVFAWIEELFWQALYKFDYIGASFLIDAVEDFLKGPEWLFNTDLFEVLKEKRQQEYEMVPITEETKNLFYIEELDKQKPVSRIKKFIYDYTYNGQARIPEFLLKKRSGVITYGGAYTPERQMLTDVNYAVDRSKKFYVVLKKDREEFSKIKKRFTDVKIKFNKEIDNVMRMFIKNKGMLIEVSSWDDYLKEDQNNEMYSK